MCTSTWVHSTLLHLWSLLKLAGLHAVIAILSMILVAGLELHTEIIVVIFFSNPRYQNLPSKILFAIAQVWV